MIKSKEAFLVELAKSSEMVDNVVAYIFAKHPNIDVSKRELYLDNLIGYYRQYKQSLDPNSLAIDVEDQHEINEIETWEGKDLRIKNVRLSGVRGYPKKDKPFGIDFTTENAEPKSMIILGPNGSGKSSIFNSIEYLYCQEVGEAKLRDYGQTEEVNVDYLRFLEHANEGKSSIYCKVETAQWPTPFHAQGENIPKSVRNKINPDTHFLSDYDIYDLGRLSYENNEDRSFHNHLTKSLGFREHLDFEYSIKRFLSYRRATESRRRKQLEKSIATNREQIKINEKAIAEQSSELEKLNKGIKSSNKLTKAKQLQQLLNELKQRSLKLPINVVTGEKLIQDFLAAFSDYNVQDKKQGLSSEVEFLSAGLKLLNDQDSCPFCQDSNKTNEVLRADVEQRIARLEAASINLRKLNAAEQEVEVFFERIFSEVASLKQQIEREIEKIEQQPEFGELVSLNNQILKEINRFTSEEPFVRIDDFIEHHGHPQLKNKRWYQMLEPFQGQIQAMLKSFEVALIELSFNRGKSIKELEERLRPMASQLDTAGQIAVAEERIKTFSQQKIEAEANVEKERKELEELLKLIAEYDEIIVQTKSFIKLFSEYLSKEVGAAFDVVKDTVEEVLDEFFKLDNRKASIHLVENEINDEQTNEAAGKCFGAKVYLENGEEMDVPRYLNTFHYRLFVSMVGIAVAIASRNKTKINLPLVFDDVFYASDFENRHAVELFIRKLFTIFKKHSQDLPLQLIMFTHDRLVFESIMNASYDDDLKEAGLSFARLFPPNEGEELEDYVNVIYQLPHHVPFNIINSMFADSKA